MNEQRESDPEIGPFSVLFRNSLKNVHAARRQFADYVNESRVEPDVDKSDLILAVGEALANAGEHGFRPGGIVTLHVLLTSEHFEAHVSDNGAGFQPPSVQMPDPLLPRGFGIHIMRTIMDVVRWGDNGRHVALIKWFGSSVSHADRG